MNKSVLHEHADSLSKQLQWLKHSLQEAESVGVKDKYSIKEYDSYENLCSRYARTIDLLVRKVFRGIDEAEFESQGTLVDVINRAHKRKLFENVEDIRRMKDLRNSIAHEYVDDGLQSFFEEVVLLSKKLVLIAETSLEYIKAID